MAKIVFDDPDEFRVLVETWRETLDSMKATLDRTGGGKAVDYGEIERETSEKCRKSERETHRVILQALDIDVPTVVIGGILSKRCEMKLQLLCDGAPEMWNLLEEGFTEDRFGGEVHRLVDLYHLTAKLGAAARVIDESEAGALLRGWKMALLNRSTAAKDIPGELIDSGMDEGPSEGHPVHAAITYLQSHYKILIA